MPKYLKKISKTNKISKWRSKGISSEIINKLPDDALAPGLGPLGRTMYLQFNGSCFKTTDKYIFFS